MLTTKQGGMKIMVKEKQFNYEAEDLTLFATRIPSDYKRFLKHKAFMDGISVQDLMIFIVSQYIAEETQNKRDIKDLIQDFRVQVQKVVK